MLGTSGAERLDAACRLTLSHRERSRPSNFPCPSIPEPSPASTKYEVRSYIRLPRRSGVEQNKPGMVEAQPQTPNTGSLSSWPKIAPITRSSFPECQRRRKTPSGSGLRLSGWGRWAGDPCIWCPLPCADWCELRRSTQRAAWQQHVPLQRTVRRWMDSPNARG
jgi:hypothetical protein